MKTLQKELREQSKEENNFILGCFLISFNVIDISAVGGVLEHSSDPRLRLRIYEAVASYPRIPGYTRLLPHILDRLYSSITLEYIRQVSPLRPVRLLPLLGLLHRRLRPSPTAVPRVRMPGETSCLFKFSRGLGIETDFRFWNQNRLSISWYYLQLWCFFLRTWD